MKVYISLSNCNSLFQLQTLVANSLMVKGKGEGCLSYFIVLFAFVLTDILILGIIILQWHNFVVFDLEHLYFEKGNNLNLDMENMNFQVRGRKWMMECIGKT